MQEKHITGWCPGSITPGGSGQGAWPFLEAKGLAFELTPMAQVETAASLSQSFLSLLPPPLPRSSHPHCRTSHSGHSLWGHVFTTPQLPLAGGASKRGAGLDRVLQGQRAVTSPLCFLSVIDSVCCCFTLRLDQ